jgi:hypothetical protein
MFDPICVKCGDDFPAKRASLRDERGNFYRTCLACGSPPGNFLVIEVNKSNPVVGTLAELTGSHKGERTW